MGQRLERLVYDILHRVTTPFSLLRTNGRLCVSEWQLRRSRPTHSLTHLARLLGRAFASGN